MMPDRTALLRELAPGQLRVAWLRLVADFSETADIRAVSRGIVKSQLHAAISRLRELVLASSLARHARRSRGRSDCGITPDRIDIGVKQA
jgi:hypothetical protein